MNPTPLALRCSESGGTTILHVGGAVVQGNTVPLERRLALLLTRVRHPLVIDLSHVHECDLTGAAVFVGAGRAASPATSVRLAGAADAVERLLRAADVLRRMPTFATVGGAVRADLTELIES